MDPTVGLVRAHSSQMLTMAMQIPSSPGSLAPQCLGGVVAHLPLWTAVLVVTLRYASGPVWRRRPPWLRRFANEKGRVGLGDEETGEDQLSLNQAKSWTPWWLALLLLSLAGVVSGVTGAVLFPPLAQQLTIPVYPSVSLSPGTRRGGNPS